jgi:hypothetical protein
VTIATLQWLRVCELIVGKGGDGVHVKANHQDGLRIEFIVEKTIRHTPNTADITVYNLDPAIERKFLDEFDDVVLSTGYEGDAHVIFLGNIKHAVSYWDRGDRKIDIQAADGDHDYRYSIVQTVLPAGTSDVDEVKAALRAMPNTKPGQIASRGKKRVRAKVISSPAREVLHSAAASLDAHWSIQDGALQIVESTGVLDTEAVVVNDQTGLLAAPELSDKGIRVMCLLNPYIQINGKLQLNNADVKVQTSQFVVNGPKSKAKHLARLSPNGVYKVYKLRHEGDSRGEGKTIVECVALGDAIPSTSTKKAVVRI